MSPSWTDCSAVYAFVLARVDWGFSFCPIRAIFYLSSSSCSSALICIHCDSIRHSEIVQTLSILSVTSFTLLVKTSILSMSFWFMFYKSDFSLCLDFSIFCMSSVISCTLLCSLSSSSVATWDKDAFTSFSSFSIEVYTWSCNDFIDVTVFSSSSLSRFCTSSRVK